LVVKEHPACIGLRPPGFLTSLQKKAGVVIARYDMPSSQILDMSAITLSVSGTASLEAFLKGRPALTLGATFFGQFLGGATGVDPLPQRIREALHSPPSTEKILDAVARVYAASGPFVMGSPFDKGSPFAKYALGKANIDNFYRCLRQELSF
jgi:Capsule polysaccharide biosynthesis protein